MDSAASLQISIPIVTIEAAAILLLIAMPAAVALGYLTGTHRRKSVAASGQEIDMAVIDTTLTAILTLLGLLLAFSFGNALVIAQAKKTTLANEAAALSTAFQRADYLEEPGRTELKRALLDYTRTRILPEGAKMTSREVANSYVATSLAVQSRLWPVTLKATADPTPVPIKIYVATGIEETLNSHVFRMSSLSHQVSNLSKFMMIAAAVAALFLIGNGAGMAGRRMSWRIFLFSGFLAVVMFATLDTERSYEGFVRIDDGLLRAALLDMEKNLADGN